MKVLVGVLDIGGFRVREQGTAILERSAKNEDPYTLK